MTIYIAHIVNPHTKTTLESYICRALTIDEALQKAHQFYSKSFEIRLGWKGYRIEVREYNPETEWGQDR